MPSPGEHDTCWSSAWPGLATAPDGSVRREGEGRLESLEERPRAGCQLEPDPAVPVVRSAVIESLQDVDRDPVWKRRTGEPGALFAWL
jgi:hypothetical protein